MLVAMLSVKGSPGVTTFALAVAACWRAGEQPVVVEADPAGGDLGMRHGLAAAPGLVGLAAAARRPCDAGVVWQHVQVLPGGVEVVVAPPDAVRVRSALTELAPEVGGGPSVLRRAADLSGVVLIVDCGRVDTGSVVLPIVREADVAVVLAGSGADGLAHLAVRLREIRSWSRLPMVVLTGRGYSTAEVAAELGVHPSGRVPLDEGTAAALCGGRGPATVSRRKLSRSALGRFAGQYADYLADLHADRGGMPGAIPGPVLGGAQSDPSWSGAAATWPPEAAS